MNKNVNITMQPGSVLTDDRYVTVLYRIVTSEKVVDVVSKNIAMNGSVGTWRSIPRATLKGIGRTFEEIVRDYGAKVCYTILKKPNEGTIFVQYPIVNFDTYGGISLLINTIAGDVLGLGGIDCIEVLDVFIPNSYAKEYMGPPCGLTEIRKRLDVNDRPILAFSVKPRLGLTPRNYAALCKQAAEGGVDIVEDDERLVNPSYCKMEERASMAAKAVHKVSEDKMYSVNISGKADQVIETTKKAIRDWGVDAVKIDVLPVGFTVLQAVSEHLHTLSQDERVPITVYPAMYSTWCHYENKRFINRKVILKLARLAGADIVYAASPRDIGRIDPASVRTIKEYHEVLRCKWMTKEKEIKPSLPTVTGGIHPGSVDVVCHLFGKDIAFFVGGAISSHPNGVWAGAEAMKLAIDSAMKGEGKILEKAQKNKSLDEALKQSWMDYVPPSRFFKDHPGLEAYRDPAFMG